MGFGSGLAAFATYFPAVLAATLIAGPSAGILALALGGIVAGSMFLGASADGAARATNLVLYAAASLLIVWVAGKHRRALRGLRDEQNRRVILLEEMQHRMRNSLAVVQAVVNQSLLSSPAKARKINRRIAALVAGNDALGDAVAAASDLKAVVASELAPYGALCVEIEGPPVSLGPGLAQSLALAVHELATNAAKYGALSVPEGHVSVSWSVSGGRVRLLWSERGGPPVVAPEAGGFGTVFVERILAASGARIATDFRPDGLRCEILLPSGAGREPAGPVAEPPD